MAFPVLNTFSATFDGDIVNGALADFSLAVATNTTLSIAGLTITPTLLTIDYSALGDVYQMSGVGSVSVPSLGNFNVNITQGPGNLFGVKSNRTYNVKNIAAYTVIDGSRRNNRAPGEDDVDSGAFEKMADVAATSDEFEKKKSCRHGWHHQRQRDERLDERFSRPAIARQEPGHSKAERGDEDRAERRYPERESEDVPLAGSHF